MRYAAVALNVPVNKSFTYHIPPRLDDLLAPGSLVRVEFGVAMQPGVVLEIKPDTPIPETKPVIELLDPQPVLAPNYLALAHWLSETCLAPIGACIWLMLPPGFTGKSDRLFRLIREDQAADQPQQLILPGADPKAVLPLPQRLQRYLLDKGPKRLTQLKRAFPKQPVALELDRLEAAGVVAVESVLAPPSARKKTIARIYPNYASEDIDDLVQGLGRLPKYAELLQLIARRDEDAIGVSDALAAVGSRSRAPLNKLIEDGLVFVEKTERGEQDLIILEAPPERIEAMLAAWRGDAFNARILRDFLAAPEPLTMKAALEQTGATRSRIKQLIAAGLLDLREQQVFRDSLRDFDFVPASAPKLTLRIRKQSGTKFGRRCIVMRRRISCCTGSPAAAKPRSTCAPSPIRLR